LYVSIVLFSLMISAVVLYYFRTRGIKHSLSKILHYDYKGYTGENPEVYFKSANLKVIPVDTPFTGDSADHEGITTERQMVDDNKLQLKENKDDTNTSKQEVDVKITTNLNPRDLNNDVIHNFKCNDKLDNMISIPDYEELRPNELLKYDTRTTMAYLKDLLIVEHTILSLVFRKSLKDPLFIRVWMLVFCLSMQFAFNALVYTDAVIDQRQVDQQNVSIY
jgi:hypothetical protein